MELLTYSILLNFPDILPNSSKILTETVNFLQKNPHAILLSNNMASWDSLKLPFPVAIATLDNTKLSSIDTNAYIIDMRKQSLSDKALSALPKSPSIRFVFIITEENRNLIEAPYFCNALFLMITDNDLKMTIPSDACKGIGLATAKGHNCKANVSFLDFPPHVIFNGEKLDGTEGMMMQTAADYLGFDLNYINRHETGWGLFHPPSGLQGDIATKTSMAAFGALYPLMQRANYSELVFGCFVTSLSWATSEGTGFSQTTWYIILVTELSTTVWACTLFTYAILIPLSKFFKVKLDNSSNVPLNILGLMLGYPQKLLLGRGLSFNIIIFGFLLTSYYRTMMSSKLTVPAKLPAIRTAKELVDSNLKLLGPPSARAILESVAHASPDDNVKAEILNKYEKTLTELDDILPKIVEEKKIAYLRHPTNMLYHAERNPRTAGKIHIVEEPLTLYYPVALFPKHSCLADRYQKVYQRLCECGLSAKWIKDLTTRRKAHNSKIPRKLAIDHVKGMLLLIFFGWILSIVTFICEKILFCVRKQKN